MTWAIDWQMIRNVVKNCLAIAFIGWLASMGWYSAKLLYVAMGMPV